MLCGLRQSVRPKVQPGEILPGLCRHPKAEESRRAPAQETAGKFLIRFQDEVLTSY